MLFNSINAEVIELTADDIYKMLDTCGALLPDPPFAYKPRIAFSENRTVLFTLEVKDRRK